MFNSISSRNQVNHIYYNKKQPRRAFGLAYIPFIIGVVTLPVWVGDREARSCWETLSREPEMLAVSPNPDDPLGEPLASDGGACCCCAWGAGWVGGSGLATTAFCETTWKPAMNVLTFLWKIKESFRAEKTKTSGQTKNNYLNNMDNLSHIKHFHE